MFYYIPTYNGLLTLRKTSMYVYYDISMYIVMSIVYGIYYVIFLDDSSLPVGLVALVCTVVINTELLG